MGSEGWDLLNSGRKSHQIPVFPQDGILLGAVGAYDWNGAVLKETSSGKVIPLRESYLQEFPEELKNHGAYLGGKTSTMPWGEIQDFIPKNKIFLMEKTCGMEHKDCAHPGRAQL